MPCLILPGGKLEWNVPYLKSIPGVLGIAEVVSCNISFGCKACFQFIYVNEQCMLGTNHFFSIQALNAIVFLCAISSGQCFRSQSYMIWPELVGAIGFWIALSLLLLQLIRGSREAVIEKLSQLTKVIHWFMIEVGHIDMIRFHDKILSPTTVYTYTNFQGALTALGCFVYLTIFLDCAVASTRTYTCFEYIPIYNIRSPGKYTPIYECR